MGGALGLGGTGGGVGGSGGTPWWRCWILRWGDVVGGAVIIVGWAE